MIAQVIPVAISPILTRIYSPEEFGALALYIAALSIVSVAACFRYELAIVQPERDEDARALVLLSLLICTILFFFFLVLIALYDYYDSDVLGLGGGNSILYFLPFGFLLNGLIQTFRYWALRKNRYKVITGVVVTQSSGTAMGQLSAGTLTSLNGLLIGQLLGQFLACIYVIWRTLRSSKLSFVSVSRKDIFMMVKTFRNMPIYSIPGALADNLSVQLPVLVISKVFGSTTVGLFSLTFRVLNLPLVALSSALSQVLFKKISDLSITSPDRIKPILIRMNVVLVSLSIPFVGFFWYFGEPVFALVFGEAWREAGAMAGLLACAVAIRFCVSPLSAVLAINANARLGMAWQFLYLATISITFFVFYDAGIEVFLRAFVVHELFIYVFYYYLILKGADRLKGF